MTETALLRDFARHIEGNILAYARSAKREQAISLKAAIGDLRMRMPNLAMTDQQLATLIVEAAFRAGRELRIDCPLKAGSKRPPSTARKHSMPNPTDET